MIFQCYFKCRDNFCIYQDVEHQSDFYVSKSYFMVTLYSLKPIDALDAQNEAQNLLFERE